MSPQRSDLLPTLHGTLGLIGAGLVGVGLGIGVAAGIFHGGAPVEAATPQASAMAEAGRDGGAAVTAPQRMLQPAAPTVAIAPAGTPDPVRSDAEAAAPPVDVAGITSVGATVPDAREMLPLVTPLEAMAPAGTPDPVQRDVEASAPPIELAGIGSPCPGCREGCEQLGGDCKSPVAGQFNQILTGVAPRARKDRVQPAVDPDTCSIPERSEPCLARRADLESVHHPPRYLERGASAQPDDGEG